MSAETMSVETMSAEIMSAEIMSTETTSAETSKKIECDMPYLRAIQEIPGDTSAKKFKWIGKLASLNFADQKAGGDLDKVPQLLQPLLQVETAIRQNTPNCEEDIKSALLSEDSLINQRALHATWFFNGSRKTINAKYFCNDIFPYVSLNTRASIIRTLANCLMKNEECDFAEDLFTTITSTYDINIALPLIVACRVTFVCDTIKEKKLILPCSIVNKFFHVKPMLAAYYLELIQPVNAEGPFAVGLDKYPGMLNKLANTHMKSFIKVCKTHHHRYKQYTHLSRKCAKQFMKEEADELISHPEIFFNVLPLDLINNQILQIIFPKLLPEEKTRFSTKIALRTLQFYPADKRLELLFKTYKDKYKTELLDNLSNVTPKLLRILPFETRIKTIESLISNPQKLKLCYKTLCLVGNYKTSWICYYSTEKAIPILMEKIKESSEPIARSEYIAQMLYCCKINHDENKLAEVMEYIITRHKNERSNVCEKIMCDFARIFPSATQLHLSEHLQSLVFKMISLFYTKHGIVKKEIIETLVKTRIYRKTQSVEDLIEILVGSHNISFDMLEDCPLYERKCLNIVGTILSEKYLPLWLKQDIKEIKALMLNKRFEEPEKNLEYIANNWKKDHKKHFSEDTSKLKSLLIEFIKAIYNFNNRCEQKYPNVNKLAIRHYPNLYYSIAIIFTNNKDNKYLENIYNILKKMEPELFLLVLSSMLSKTTDSDGIVNLRSIIQFERLKKNPKYILDNWEKYLEECKQQLYLKSVQRFIKAIRWYQTIPIKFAERCIEDLNGNDKRNKRFALIILSILLHSDTLIKIIISVYQPIVPEIKISDSESKNARENYQIVDAITTCIQLSNPPISLDIITKLSEDDFLSLTLVALMNISRRSSLTKVLELVQQWLSMRVSMRKHGIRLLQYVSTMQEYINGLDQLWTTEKNLSLREIIFGEANRLFLNTPCVKTWMLYCKMFSTATVKDYMMISPQMLPSHLMKCNLSKIPDGITQYILLWYSKIDYFQTQMTSTELDKYINTFVSTLNDKFLFKFVPDNVADEVITKYFFHDKSSIRESSQTFALEYIFTKDPEKFDARAKKLLDVIRNYVKNGWGKPHPLTDYFYPVNHIFRIFITNFTVECLRLRYEQSFNPKIVDDMSAVFKSYLLPVQDMRSYLMLEYTKLFLKCISENAENEFGLRLSLYIPYLVEMFTPLLVSFMATILHEFLVDAYTHDQHNNIDIIVEDLIRSQNIPCIIIAVMLISRNDIKDDKYKDLIKKCMKMGHPAVTAVLQNYLNSLNSNN